MALNQRRVTRARHQEGVVGERLTEFGKERREGGGVSLHD